MVRVEDLMRWSCLQPTCWSKAASCGTNGVHRPPQNEEPPRGSAQSENRLVLA